MKKGFLKTAIEINTICFDAGTGEVISEVKQTNKYLANDREQFFFCYYSLMSVIQNLSGPAIQTYFYLVLNYNPGTTLVGINKAVKQRIKEYIKSKSIGTISNCITQLCKEGLLLKDKDCRGGYYINPRYVYKGGSIERKKVLKTIIETVNEEA